MDSYIVTVIDNETGRVKTAAEWECVPHDAPDGNATMYAAAATFINATVAEFGTTNVTTSIKLCMA